MIALEDRAHERAIDGPALAREDLRQLLAPLDERRRALAGPHKGVEREPRHALGMTLREERRAQRARRDPVGGQLAYFSRTKDVVGRRLEIVSAVGDVA